MHILPTIRPISPLSDTVTAQASSRAPSYNDSYANGAARGDEKASKKVGRQLSVASSTNHYADVHRQQAERALNGNSGLASPPSSHRESFFSHLRKRARRLSGRHQTPTSPTYDDVEAQAGCGPWASNRSSMVIDSSSPAPPAKDTYESLDKALREVQANVEAAAAAAALVNQHHQQRQQQQQQPLAVPAHNSHALYQSVAANGSNLKRHHSLPHNQYRSADNLIVVARTTGGTVGPVSSRTRTTITTATTNTTT